MSTISPFLEQVVYLVCDFLKTIQHSKQADIIRKQFKIPEWVQKNNLLLKKGLKKALKQYINSNQKMLKYYRNRKKQSDQQSQEEQKHIKKINNKEKEVTPKSSPKIVNAKSPKVNDKITQQTKPKGWMASQFAQPKRLQDLNDIHQEEQSKKQIQKKQKTVNKKIKKAETSQEQSSQQQQKPMTKKIQKAIKKQKKEKGPVDSSYLNSQQQFQLEPKKTKKVQPIKTIKEQPIKQIKSKVQTRKQSTQIMQQQQNDNKNTFEEKNNMNGPKQFFSRIIKQQVGFIPQNRRDNTFQAKAKYGAGDGWGQQGYQKLKVTRGQSFKKTKGKLKNKAFQGTGINMNQINSVPIM